MKFLSALIYVTDFEKTKDFYLHALEKFGLEAGEAVFIDDLAENIETANRLGMTGLQFSGPEKLEADLKGLGLL